MANTREVSDEIKVNAGGVSDAMMVNSVGVMNCW